MRPFILGLLAAAWAGASAHAADQGKPPNIVILLADDLGYADVGFNGCRDIQTPNLDRLAASGTKLTAFYVQPVCSPTRAALMTGRYPMRHGLQVGVVRPWAQYGLPLEERTLAQALQEAGYETAICGKWHLGHFRREYLPTQRGFTHQYGHYNGALDYFTHIRDGGFDWHRDDHVCHDEGYTTHLLTREAIRLIRERDVKKPLFLYVPFNAVHAPLQAPEKYTQPYAALPRPRRTYAGMVAALDEAVGQILAALKDNGMSRDTLVIFHSDNGGPQPGVVTSNGPLRAGKGTLYEGGVRVAACVAWEGKLQPGRAVDAPLHVVDWYPTLLTLAGASPRQPLPLDGKDVWPTLAEGKPSPHDALLLNTTPRNGAVRMGDWKLVLNGAVGDNGSEQPGGAGQRAEKLELFNLATDPREQTNLAGEHPDKVKELRARLAQFAGEAAPPRIRPKPQDYKAPKVWGEPNP